MLPRTDPTTEGDEVRWGLTVWTNAGLCNRLRVLLSGLALAQATGRLFAMRWAAHPAGVSFDRLFQNEWNVGEDVPLDERRLINLEERPWGAFPDLMKAKDNWLVVSHFDWLIRPARYPSHAALKDKCVALVQALKPAPALQERIHAFRADFFRARMIGVHLRRGDFVNFRPDVVDNLMASMQAVDRWLDQAPDAGILLCTDDGAANPFTGRQVPYEGVAEKYVERYGTRVVVTRPRTLDRHLAQATEDALVDLWLLRSTDWFVGTHGSSFSEMAVFGRAVPAVQTGTPTREYEAKIRRLKRIGLYGIYSRVSHYEYGRVIPFALLRHRFRMHLNGLIRRNGSGKYSGKSYDRAS